jgi:hypothetical protein
VFDNNSFIRNNSGDNSSLFLSLFRLPFGRPFDLFAVDFVFFVRRRLLVFIASFSASLRTVCLLAIAYAFRSATLTAEKTKNSNPLTTWL